MGFFSFVSSAWDSLKSLPSKAWDTVKNGASDAWSTVKHAAGSVTKLVKLGAKAIGKAAPIVYHKAEDVAKTLLLFFDSFILYSITTMASSPTKKAIDANRGKVAPFVTNQVSLHDHQPQKINGKVYNFRSAQIPNLDQHVATMTIPLQVSVPASFFSSSSNYYSFKMQASCYSCKNLTLEMDLTRVVPAEGEN